MQWIAMRITSDDEAPECVGPFRKRHTAEATAERLHKHEHGSAMWAAMPLPSEEQYRRYRRFTWYPGEVTISDGDFTEQEIHVLLAEGVAAWRVWREVLARDEAEGVV